MSKLATMLLATTVATSVTAQEGATPTSTYFENAKITVNERARADGFMRVRVIPENGAPREATLAIARRMSENDLAKGIAESLNTVLAAGVCCRQGQRRAREDSEEAEGRGELLGGDHVQRTGLRGHPRQLRSRRLSRALLARSRRAAESLRASRSSRARAAGRARSDALRLAGPASRRAGGGVAVPNRQSE